jgi:hypothetical protein
VSCPVVRGLIPLPRSEQGIFLLLANFPVIEDYIKRIAKNWTYDKFYFIMFQIPGPMRRAGREG